MRIGVIGIKSLVGSEGAARAVEAVGRSLGDRHSFTVYCAEEPPQSVGVGWASIKRVPAPRGKHIRATSLFAFAALHALFAGDFDVIHLHNVEASFVAPLLRLRYPIVTTSHGRPHRVDKWNPLAKLLLRLAEYPFAYSSTVRTCVSRAIADEYEARYRRRVLYIPNGVDAADLSGVDDDACLEKLGLRTGGYLLFSAARIDPVKGCHLLLEAYGEVRTGIPLVVVGAPVQLSGYDQGLRSEAPGGVRFMPAALSRPELGALLRGSRLFVFPSTEEAMSMMLLEAAAAGARVLASDLPQNEAVLGENAIYFTSGDATDLAGRLEWALENPAHMDELAGRLAARTLRLFDWRVIAAEYERAYELCAESAWKRRRGRPKRADEGGAAGTPGGRTTDTLGGG